MSGSFGGGYGMSGNYGYNSNFNGGFSSNSFFNSGAGLPGVPGRYNIMMHQEPSLHEEVQRQSPERSVPKES